MTTAASSRPSGRAASIRLTDLIEWGGAPQKQQVVQAIAEALAHKRGQTVEEVIEEHRHKAAKRGDPCTAPVGLLGLPDNPIPLGGS